MTAAATAPATRSAPARASRAGVLQVARPGLIEALSRVMATVPTKSTIPVLAGVKISTDAKRGVLTFQTTTLEQSTTAEVPVARLGLDEAALAIAGVPTFVVPAKRLLDIAKSMHAGSIALEVSAARLRVVGGTSKFDVALLPADEYPTTERHEEAACTITAAGASLLAALSRAVPFLSTAESRPILNGALIDADGREVAVVGMDGAMAYREVVATEGPMPTGQWIIPPAAIRAITSGGTPAERVTLTCTSQQVQALLEDAKGRLTVESRLIEGPYPNYRQVTRIPTDRYAVVGREAFAAALDQVAIVLREELAVKRVTAQWSDRSVTLSAKAESGTAEAVVPCTGQHMDDFRHAFDLVKVKPALHALAGEDVALFMSTPERAVFLTDGAGERPASLTTGALFMPLRMVD